MLVVQKGVGLFGILRLKRDSRIGRWSSFRDLLHKPCKPVDRPDVLSWELGSNKLFSLCSFYKKLLVRAEDSFPHDSVWVPKMLKKVCFFTWLATRGMILMAESIMKRKVVCISWWLLYKEAGKDIDHILLYCKQATRLWWDIFRWLGISWTMPRSMKELLFSWKSGARRRRHNVWKVTPLAQCGSFGKRDIKEFLKGWRWVLLS